MISSGLRELADHEKQVLAAYRNRATDDQQVQPAGGGTREVFQLVKVKLAGGDPGTHSTPCTFVYDIFDPAADIDADEPIATELSPLTPRRTAVGTYDAAPDGSFARAFFNTFDDSLVDFGWVLYSTQERPDNFPCEWP